MVAGSLLQPFPLLRRRALFQAQNYFLCHFYFDLVTRESNLGRLLSQCLPPPAQLLGLFLTYIPQSYCQYLIGKKTKCLWWFLYIRITSKDSYILCFYFTLYQGCQPMQLEKSFGDIRKNKKRRKNYLYLQIMQYIHRKPQRIHDKTNFIKYQ